jgi:hypothetical protein
VRDLLEETPRSVSASRVAVEVSKSSFNRTTRLDLRWHPYPNARTARANRDLTILGRQRDDDGQNKLLQINGSKDNSWYITNRMNLIQS